MKQQDFIQLCIKAMNEPGGLCLGEKHGDGMWVRQLLIDCVKELKQHVNWIGLEAPGDLLQHNLDHNKELDLTTSLMNGLRGKNPGLGDIAAAWIEAGVRVACYDYQLEIGVKTVNKDTAALIQKLADKNLKSPVPERWIKEGKTERYTEIAEWEKTGNMFNRCMAMNYYSGHRIQHLGFPTKGWIVLVGAKHLDEKFLGKRRGFQTRLRRYVGYEPIVQDATQWKEE